MRQNDQENLIIETQDVCKAYYYARDIIKGRWIEVESFIMKDPTWAHLYSRDVIKGRWLDAEPIIMTDTLMIYYYAKDVIKGSWPEISIFIIDKYFIFSPYSIFDINDFIKNQFGYIIGYYL